MSYAVEDLVNQALDRIGFSFHIADIYEGSPAARVALEVYSLTRDTLLQQGDWPFAERRVTLATNGQTALTPFSYEYTYPSDCLRIKNLRPAPLTGGAYDNDPQPQLFRPFNDNRLNPPQRAILANLSPAVLVYIGQVIDPATWEPEFTEAFVAALAEKMAFMLSQSADVAKAAVELAAGERTDGMAVDDLSAPRSGLPAAARSQ